MCLFKEIQYLVPPPPPSLYLGHSGYHMSSFSFVAKENWTKGLLFILSNAFLLNHETILCVLWLQCLFDPNKEKNEDLDLSVFNPLSQEEAVSKIVWGMEKNMIWNEYAFAVRVPETLS